MSGKSPAVVIYSSDGTELTVVPGSAIPANTRGILSEGSDGTNARSILVDSSGRQVVVGAGTAGTQTGGVLTIQGDPSGTPIPISGSISATNPSVGVTGSTIPGDATFIGGTDGTNLRGVAAINTTPAGTEYALVTRNIPSGTQAVSGTVTSNIGTTNGLALDSSVNGILLAQNSTTSGQLGPLVQGAVTTSSPSYTTAKTSPLSLTTAGALRIDGSAVTQPVSGTVAATQSGTWTVQPGNTANTTPWLLTISQGGNSATVTASNALKVDGSAVTQPVSGTVTANAGTGVFSVVTNKASTSSLTNVNGSATNVTLLASNSNRLFSAIYNDSTSKLYVKLGTTASATSFTMLVFPGSYWEVPINYTGEIDGIWASAVGAARVTELTA